MSNSNNIKEGLLYIALRLSTLKFSMNPPPPSGTLLPPSVRGTLGSDASPSMHWEREDSSDRSASKSDERVRDWDHKMREIEAQVL